MSTRLVLDTTYNRSVVMRQESSSRALFTLALIVLPLVFAACGKTIAETTDDATITARVKTMLLPAPPLGATRIDVETTQGVVTMSGTVKSQAEADRAVQLARQAPGVKDVKSTLQVAPNP